MSLGIKTKVVLVTAGIMSFSTVAIILTSAHFFTKEYAESLKLRSLAVGKSLQLQLEKVIQLGLQLEDVAGVNEQLREVVDKYEGINHAMVVDINGRVLFHNDPAERGKRLTDASVLEAIRSPGDIVTACTEHGVGNYHAIVPVFAANGEHIAAVRICIPADLISQKTKKMALYAAGAGIPFLGVAMISLIIALKSLFTRPMAKLLAFIEEIREKGPVLAGKVEIGTKDEIGLLASAFNSMTEDLRESTVSKKELELKVEERSRQLLDVQEELVRNEKLSILGQLAGTVGHELRNPLGVINNALYFLNTVLSDADDTVREYLNIIKNEVDNSHRIVSDLLDFSRTRPPRARVIHVHDIIQQSLGRCTIPENIRFEADASARLPKIFVDPLQMGQVFQNLIANAVQAMPEGGTLRISAATVRKSGSAEARKQETSELPNFRTPALNGDFIETSVADTGEGIAPENMKKLFQPLFTTKERGIGLGLFVCKNLTEANGGKIEVRSELGKGTTFTIILPVGEDSG